MIPRTISLAAVIVWSGCVQRDSHETPAPLFRDIAAESGLIFQHFAGATAEHFLPEIMGGGAAVLDYDNDGDLDIYLVQGSALDSQAKLLFPPRTDRIPGDRLFRNELIPTGKLTFTDRTQAARISHAGAGMGVATGDYDNDGYFDLYVSSFGHNVLYHNNRDGTFTDVTAVAGVDDTRWSTSAAFFDYDRDGKLDLFVANYLDFSVKGNKRCYAATGEPDYCTPKAYRPVPSSLFHNLGNGKFADVTASSNIGSSYGPGLGVVCADFNGDGWLDVYIANDTAANLLWLNNGDGTFREAGLESGLAYAADGIARAGMGVAAADFDNDGRDDILVTNLVREGATLFRNTGSGQFEDGTVQSGIAELTSPFTGFGAGWLDYDNDGLLDVFITNGAVTIVEALRGQPYPYQQRNRLLRNAGPGKFRNATIGAGPALQSQGVGRGTAFGDIDNDGDIDILVTNNNGPVRLLRNDTGSRQHWLMVRLAAPGPNRFGIGARVALIRQGKPALWRRVHTDSSYLSANDPRVHFGLGPNLSAASVVVEWPDGFKETWTNLEPDRIVLLRRGSGTALR